jgi:diaminohydroxyphosphoribosylaminopyrimidine deaminase/5-amino-6-(5-phosphoribosylamino)uracil reductase
VVHKLAFQETEAGDLSMIPDPGEKTFTSPDSLRLAHLERRQSDGILTGMGTVLADQPLFNVRHVPDHPGKTRFLAVIGDGGRLSATAKATWDSWVTRQNASGFKVSLHASVPNALKALGDGGCLRVLAEAGPKLSEILRLSGLWQERLVVIKRRKLYSDIILRSYHVHWDHY